MKTLQQQPVTSVVARKSNKQNNFHFSNAENKATMSQIVSSRQTLVHPKLELTTPGDTYEQEADRVADFVMRKSGSSLGSEQPSTTSIFPPTISRNSSTGGVAVGASTESGINASRGSGQPMPSALLARMESGFGQDFSAVRLHTGSNAVQMNRDLGAKAFTYGNDIYFNSGQYQPHSHQGQRLLAHELTHVVQQNGKVGRYCPGCEARVIAIGEMAKIREKKIVDEDIAIILKDSPTYVFLTTYMPALMSIGEEIPYNKEQLEKAKKLLDGMIANRSKINNIILEGEKNLSVLSDGVQVDFKELTKYGWRGMNIKVHPWVTEMQTQRTLNIDELAKIENNIATIEKDLNKLLKIAKTARITFLVAGKILNAIQAAELVYRYHKKKHGNWSKSQEYDLYVDTTLFFIGFAGLPGALLSTTLGVLYHQAGDWLKNGGAQEIRKNTINFFNIGGGGFIDWSFFL